MAVVGDGGCAAATAVAMAVAEAVDVDALQLLADVGQLGVGTVRRRLGPANKTKGTGSTFPFIVISLPRKKCDSLLGSNCIPFAQSSKNS